MDIHRSKQPRLLSDFIEQLTVGGKTYGSQVQGKGEARGRVMANVSRADWSRRGGGVRRNEVTAAAGGWNRWDIAAEGGQAHGGTWRGSRHGGFCLNFRRQGDHHTLAVTMARVQGGFEEKK